jgi:DNA-directed RNA polymerase specialized sigma subunit
MPVIVIRVRVTKFQADNVRIKELVGVDDKTDRLFYLNRQIEQIYIEAPQPVDVRDPERAALALAERKKGKTYKEIGNLLGVSASRALQIVNREIRREKKSALP